MRQINKVMESINTDEIICNTSIRVMLNEEVDIQKPGAVMDRIIKEGGNAYVDEIRIRENQVMIGGILDYEVLFAEKKTGQPQSEMGQLRFEDMIKIPELKEEDDVCLDARVDWITARVVNEKKIILKAQITVYATATKSNSFEVMCDVENHPDLQVSKNRMEIVESVKKMSDTMRIKDKFAIPSGKPSIMNIIWKEIKMKNITTKLGEGNINVTGEMDIFFMYIPDEENGMQQWQETTVPFTGIVDIPGIAGMDFSDLISYTEVKMQNAELIPIANEMGENHEVEVDLLLKLDIKIFKEKEREVLGDMYSLETNVQLLKNRVSYNKLLVKNTSRSRNVIKINLSGGRDNVLQICGSGADVRIDGISVNGDGLVAEGKINAYVIYATTDDTNPLCTVTKEMDFSHRIDAEGISREDDYYVNWHVEQTTANMISTEEIEVRTIIVMEAFVLQKCCQELVVDIQEEEDTKIKNAPFIRAHVVQNGETLWKLAKANRTTVDRIKMLNNIKGEQVQAGDRIIVAKH